VITPLDSIEILIVDLNITSREIYSSAHLRVAVYEARSCHVQEHTHHHINKGTLSCQLSISGNKTVFKGTRIYGDV
jgi:hypothetical protein